MRKFLKDLFTGVDGETYDLGRILLAVGCIMMSAGGIDVMIDGTLDFMAFGAGFGGLLTGGGALLILKSSTEPSVSTTKTVEIEREDSKASLEIEEKG